MVPEISEFSFGFAFTSELIHHYNMALTGAPRFPTQAEEGKVGGYDVELPKPGMPVFHQFKRSECLVRKSALEFASLGVPYYRMHLHPTRFSMQHQLLLDLETSGQEVYYATPRFHTAEELNDAYLANEVAERSTLIRLSFIGPLPDDRNHYVSIASAGLLQEFHSDTGRRIKGIASRVVLRELTERAATRSRRQDRGALLELGDHLQRLFSRRSDRVREAEEASSAARVDVRERDRTRRLLIERAGRLRRERAPSEYLQETAQALFGCEVLFALRENDSHADG